MSDESSSVSVGVANGPTVTVPWVSGMNAQQALEGAWDASSGKISYAIRYYGKAYGYLVSMINETYDTFIGAQDPFFYWEFFVDGEPAAQGIDNTILQPGAAVTFSYVLWNPGTHSPQLEAKHSARRPSVAA